MNPEALRRRAMALGAKLEIDGKTFNASRVQGKHTPPPPKVVVPPPAPVVKPDPSLEAIAQFTGATYLLHKDVADQLQAMQKQIDHLVALASVKPEKSPARKYTVRRDDKGNLVSFQSSET